MAGVLSTGLSGLSAAYLGLQATSHNIANVSTPGFRRQEIRQSTALPVAFGSGFVGNGVIVTDTVRAYDSLLVRQVQLAQSAAAKVDTEVTYLQRLDPVLNDTESGVGVNTDGLFNSLQALASRPADGSTRAAFLTQAQNFVDAFSRAAGQIAELKTSAEQGLQQAVSDVNQFANQIAGLNLQISIGYASGHPPNDFLDQREQLLTELAKRIGITTTNQSDGSIGVFVGTGQPLVVGQQVNVLIAGQDASDPAKQALFLNSGVAGSGNVFVANSANSLAGGTIAGYLNVHNVDLVTVEANLGRLAVAVTDPLNTQHKLGLDPSGAAGGNLFNISGPVVVSSSGNPSAATATPGAVSLAVSNATQLKASDYDLIFNGTTFTATRLSDGQQTTGLPAAGFTLDGFTATITGTPLTGDRFTLKPVSTRASGLSLAITEQSRLALALPIASTSAATNSGTVNVQSLVITNPANANLLQPVTLTFTGGSTFDVTGVGTGNPTGIAYTPGGTVSYNGYTIQLTGTPRAGDKITIGPNLNLAGDNRNALLLASNASKPIVDGQTPAQSYGATLAALGGRTRTAELESKAQTQLLTNAQNEETSFSGVNIDEEATRLIQYQKAYEASAKVLSTALSLIDSLLQI